MPGFTQHSTVVHTPDVPVAVAWVGRKRVVTILYSARRLSRPCSTTKHKTQTQKTK